jgi:hypothetical protein
MKIFWHRAAWIVLASLAQGPIAFAHWPDQAPHQMAYLGDLQLEGGGVIPRPATGCIVLFLPSLRGRSRWYEFST